MRSNRSPLRRCCRRSGAKRGMSKRIGKVSAVVLVGALWVVAASRGAADHERLPLKNRVQKASRTELRLGYGEDRLFGWSMWALDRPWSPTHDRVCLTVDVLGPLAHLPNGQSMGAETGGRGCGPIKAKQGTVVVVPTQGGSQTLPTGETESWQPFDVGVAAYRPSPRSPDFRRWRIRSLEGPCGSQPPRIQGSRTLPLCPLCF